MASAINVTALTDYVEVHKDELFVKSVAGAKTLEFVEIMPNVKYKDALIYLDSTATIQADSCGWNPTGEDAFTEKYVEVKSVKIEKEWCWLDFAKKAQNYMLAFEAGRESMPYEQKLAENNVEQIKKSVEDIVWGGDATLGIDGFKAQITGATDSISASTASTVTGTIDNLVAGCTNEMLEKGVDIFMSYATFRAYVQEQNAYCCANRPIIDAASDTLLYVGDSRVRLIPVLGLDGKSFAAATSRGNLVYATDIEGSEGVYKMWRDEKSDMVDFRVRFNIGTAIKFTDEVVYVNL